MGKVPFEHLNKTMMPFENREKSISNAENNEPSSNDVKFEGIKQEYGDVLPTDIKLIKEDSNVCQKYYNDGLELLEQKKIEDAISMIRKCVEFGSNDSKKYLTLGSL